MFCQKYGKNSLEEVEQLIYKEREGVKKTITEKTNRIAQLDKLFKGTATIFQKQHNFVDHLKEKLKKEQTEKGISEEKAKHLQTDISQLDQQKEELGQRIKELEQEEIKSKAARDKKIEELKAKNNNLTMEREKSEERLKKQNEELLKVQEINRVVYDILGEHSDKTELLLRSQEVVQKLKDVKKRDLTEKEIKALDLLYSFNIFNKAKLKEAIEKQIKTFEEEFKVKWTGTSTSDNLPHKLGEYSILGIVESILKLSMDYLETHSRLQKELN